MVLASLFSFRLRIQNLSGLTSCWARAICMLLRILMRAETRAHFLTSLPSILWVFRWNTYLKTDGTSLLILFLVKDPKLNSVIMTMEWFHRMFVGIDLMLSGGNLHASQDSHESIDQSPFSNINSINFWWNPSIRILSVPFFKTGGTRLLILFPVKDPKFACSSGFSWEQRPEPIF